MAQNCLLASSRVTYAYARDGLFPLSGIWKKCRQNPNPNQCSYHELYCRRIVIIIDFRGDVSIGSILVLVHLLDSFHLLCQHF